MPPAVGTGQVAEGPARSKNPKSGPARQLKPQAETFAGIALATSAAHAADWIRDVPSPQVTVMLWTCVIALVFGFSWAAYRLVHPR
jgi:hypothetical protein